MECGDCDFESWLSDKLRALSTDEGVFGSYITSILDGEESLDEKKDAIEAILSECVESNIGVHVSAILEKWQSCRMGVGAARAATPAATDVNAQLSRLLETAVPPLAAPRSYTDDERRVREAILSQYSQLSDCEDGGGGVAAGEGGGGAGLERNTNAASVAAAARERREQARLDSQRKKDKDKEDREKQKQLKEEKKEKRKTQKGERKR